MGVDQVPVVVDVHRVPAVVVFGALELVTRAVVQTLGKTCQHCTEQAGIPTAKLSLFTQQKYHNDSKHLKTTQLTITMIQSYIDETFCFLI